MQNPFVAYFNSFSQIHRNVWILAISFFINRSGSMVLLFTSLYLTNELHFTEAQAAITMSAYGVGSIAGSFIGGWLTDRYHYYNIMIYTLLGSGSILFFFPFVTNYYVIVGIVFIYALVADMFRPANNKAVSLYTNPENRTRSVSLVRLAVNLGFSVGPAMGGFVAYHAGYTPVYLIDGMTSIGAAIMLLIYLPRKDQNLPKSAMSENSTSDVSAYRNGPYLFFILLVALFASGFFQLFASVPVYFDEVCHYHEDTIGLVIALNGLLVVLIEMPIVAALEKNKKPFHLMALGSLCISLAFGILYLGGGLLFWALIYTIIITLAEIFAMPFMMTYALSRSTKRQGEYTALYSIAYGIGNIVAPMIGLGIAGAYDYTTMFTVIVVLGLVTCIGFLALSKHHTNNLQS